MEKDGHVARNGTATARHNATTRHGQDTSGCAAQMAPNTSINHGDDDDDSCSILEF